MEISQKEDGTYLDGEGNVLEVKVLLIAGHEINYVTVQDQNFPVCVPGAFEEIVPDHRGKLSSALGNPNLFQET